MSLQEVSRSFRRMAQSEASCPACKGRGRGGRQLQGGLPQGRHALVASAALLHAHPIRAPGPTCRKDRSRPTSTLMQSKALWVNCGGAQAPSGSLPLPGPRERCPQRAGGGEGASCFPASMEHREALTFPLPSPVGSRREETPRRGRAGQGRAAPHLDVVSQLHGAVFCLVGQMDAVQVLEGRGGEARLDGSTAARRALQGALLWQGTRLALGHAAPTERLAQGPARRSWRACSSLCPQEETEGHWRAGGREGTSLVHTHPPGSLT